MFKTYMMCFYDVNGELMIVISIQLRRETWWFRL